MDCSVAHDSLFHMFIAIRLHHYRNKTHPAEDYRALRQLLKEFHGSHTIQDAIEYIEDHHQNKPEYASLLDIMKKKIQPKRQQSYNTVSSLPS